MCSHPEHRVEVLPDGQVDETHVFSLEEPSLTEEQMSRLYSRLRNVAGTVFVSSTVPQEVVLDGQ